MGHDVERLSVVWPGCSLTLFMQGVFNFSIYPFMACQTITERSIFCQNLFSCFMLKMFLSRLFSPGCQHVRHSKKGKDSKGLVCVSFLLIITLELTLL